jgi:DNA-binding GntR family transcriptional regulator
MEMREEPFLDPEIVQEDMRIQSVPEQVYRVIRHAIVSGRFKPGEWLRQRDLARELGVSISSVREALNRLAAQGFLVAETNRGFGTVIPTLGYMVDHGEVLRLLEPRVLELAAARISEQDLDRMRELLPATVYTPGKEIEFREAEHAFHAIAWQASGREYLVQLLEQTWVNYAVIPFLAPLYNDEERAEVNRITQAYTPVILTGLEARDGRWASETCAALWESDLEMVTAAFKRMEQQVVSAG